MRNFKGLSVILVAALFLSACSNDPYFTKPPEKLLNRYAYHPPNTTYDFPEEAYLVSLCYGRQSDDATQVMERAGELCPSGELTIYGQDTFWNDCALFHPVRVTLICNPADQSN